MRALDFGFPVLYFLTDLDEVFLFRSNEYRICTEMSGKPSYSDAVSNRMKCKQHPWNVNHARKHAKAPTGQQT